MKHFRPLVFFTLALISWEWGMPRICSAETSAGNSDPQRIRALEQNPENVLPANSTASPITLELALDIAFNRHPSLAATWYEIKAKQGAAQQSGELPNPTVFGEIEEFGGTGDFAGSDVMSSRFGIRQEISLGGKIGKRMREADVAVEISNLEHQVHVIDFSALVERRFWEVFILQERLRLQEEQIDLIEKTHDVVSKRVKVGDTSPMDLARSKVELASAKISLVQTVQGLEAARYALAGSWGSYEPNFTEVSGANLIDEHLSEQDVFEALPKSPAWKLLEKQIALNEAALDLAKAERIPDIELEGGVQRFSESDDHAFFVGVSVPLPLFDRNRGRIAENKALKQKSHFEKEAGFLALRTELQDAWHKNISTRQSFESLEMEVLPAAQRAYDSTSKAYKAGEVDILELLSAQKTWVEMRDARLTLLHELVASRGEIRRLISEGALVSPASIAAADSTIIKGDYP